MQVTEACVDTEMVPATRRADATVGFRARLSLDRSLGILVAHSGSLKAVAWKHVMSDASALPALTLLRCFGSEEFVAQGTQAAQPSLRMPRRIPSEGLESDGRSNLLHLHTSAPGEDPPWTQNFPRPQGSPGR